MFSCFMNSIRKNMFEGCRSCINLAFNYLAYKIAGYDMRCYKSHAEEIKKMYF